MSGIMILLVADAVQLVMPKLLGYITDSLENRSLTSKSMYILLGIMLLGAVIISLCRYGWRMLIFGNARKLEFHLRNKLFSHLETLSQNYFNNHKTGDLMACATNDINAIKLCFGGGIVMMVDSIFLVSLTAITMFLTIDASLTVIAIFPMVIIPIIFLTLGKKVHRRFKIVQKYFGKITDNVQENISGIRIVKSFVQEEGECEKFKNLNEENVEKNMDLIKILALAQPMTMFISAISSIIAILYGGFMVIDKSITLGDLVSFITYLGLLTWPMMAVGQVVNVIQRGTASMERINEILNTKPEIYDKEDCFESEKLKGNIKINNLTFYYTNTTVPALKNINIDLKAGSTLAVVGKTGSGKTTLVNLLLRLYEVPNGKVFLDGMDINYIPLGVLRKNIGFVPQDNFLFSRSIEKNIAFSDSNLSYEEVEKAAIMSQVHSEILSFPKGYQTSLGERGVNLSGGQKQRISISRALVKKPNILIFDDCLSAVDTNTEEKILKYLNEETSNRTSIIISHRISSIKNANEIIVLDDGSIVEHGTHQELLENNGLYKELYDMQESSPHNTPCEPEL
ncbi:ABC transporter ATP-binding protein [Hathewaya proteolytica]|uniref:ABC transporter ATP-binding protein n=1 Tax=Hathewaya proteolytica TaxID=29365 RepID=UPI001FA8C398|nr:ABC transporter ATP-binding protein [Hathewaya proteolytica]